MSDTTGGLVSKDLAVRMVRAVRKSEREEGKTMKSAGKSDPRRVYGTGWSLGVVVCKGPDNQDDFANNRYWVQQALPTTASGVVAAVGIPGGWIRAATNLFECLGTYLVSPGTTVVVLEGISVEGAACYYLITAAESCGTPCPASSSGASSGVSSGASSGASGLSSGASGTPSGGGSGTPSGGESGATCAVPCPPGSGSYVLRANNGVMEWVPTCG